MKEIKFWCLIFTMSIILGGVIGWNLEEINMPYEEFSIYHSYIFDGGGYKRTLLQVIVHKKKYNLPELFEEIREFHDRMNGVPDELKIELYDSKDSLSHGDMIDEITYFKDPG